MGQFGRAEPDVTCPVSLELLGDLYRADPGEVSDLLGDMTEDRRARLAFYCYSKAHMRGLALTIAETCDAERLGQLAGVLGEVLAAQCRRKVREFGADYGSGRAPRKITLASMAG